MPFLSLSLSLSQSIVFHAESEEGKRSLEETLVAEAITVIKIAARREDSMAHFANCDLHPHSPSYVLCVARRTYICFLLVALSKI